MEILSTHRPGSWNYLVHVEQVHGINNAHRSGSWDYLVHVDQVHRII